MKTNITPQRVRELLNYCSISGKFHWKVHRNSQAMLGQEAGHYCVSTGYQVIGFDYKVHQAHRLAWLHHYGSWPKADIDHINHSRTDNRVCNLRVVTDAINLKNKSKSKANSSGHTGVYRTAVGNWLARICVDRKVINLGTFHTITLALEARKSAEVLHNFHVNHGV